MDSDHNESVPESSISNQDWNLIWGAFEEGTYRGVPVRDAQDELDLVNLQPKKTKNFEQQTEDRRDPPPNIIQEVDPMFLTRCVMLAAQVALPMVFQFVLDFVQEHEQTGGNFVSSKMSATIRGGLFDETRFAEYQIKIFTFGGRLGLTLDVMEGFAPAVQEFWNELQTALKQSDFTEPENDDESDEELDFLDSDDEFEPLDLDDAKYLNLHESPELVHQWFQDLSNPNFMQQTLLLMAWNCQNEQNFQTLTGEKQAQQLFDTIIACMFATAADFCLPIARCASMLVSQLVDAHDIKITNEQFNVLVETLVKWTISNQQSEQHDEKLTSSKEVASILSQQMSKMAPLAANRKDTLERVYTQAPYDCVRENLQGVVRAY